MKISTIQIPKVKDRQKHTCIHTILHREGQAGKQINLHLFQKSKSYGNIFHINDMMQNHGKKYYYDASLME